MSSFVRSLQRKRLRNSPDYEPKAQPVRFLPDGGYATLTTNGWVTVSARRLLAQRKLADIHERAAMHSRPAQGPRLVKAPRNDDPTYRKSIWPSAKIAKHLTV